MEMGKVRRICCIGAGYVGGPTCAVIALQNPEVDVTVVDLDKARIERWRSSTLPIYEPQLLEVVQSARDGGDGRRPNLFFSTDISTTVQAADIIFIAVNTPTKVSGLGAGSASDIGYVESAARMIAEAATEDKIVVEKSTVPCGTAERLRSIFASLAPTLRFDILSNPEFLAEGTAIEDLLNPDRVLIGSLPDQRSVAAARRLCSVYSWVQHDKIMQVNLWSSELAKLAANCMLAQRISSINSLAAICEASGANISEVATAVGVDSRIGKHMLKASAGFGGSCFKKDVLSLVYIAQSLHLYEVASYWQNVVTINEYSKARFAKRIVSALHGSLRRKKIAIFGWAYKRNTGDSRESAAIGIALQLLAEGAELAVYDPQVSFDPEQIYRDLENEFPAARSRVRVCKDPVQACRSACAVVIMTEWDQFKSDRLPLYSFNEDDQGGKSNNRTIISVNTAASSDSGIDLGDDMADCCPAADGANSEHIQHLNDRVDWQKIADVVRRPRLIFDGRNVVDARALATVGFTVESIGKSTV